jgi:hypothetical protein
MDTQTTASRIEFSPVLGTVFSKTEYDRRFCVWKAMLGFAFEKINSGRLIRVRVGASFSRQEILIGKLQRYVAIKLD